MNNHNKADGFERRLEVSVAPMMAGQHVHSWAL